MSIERELKVLADAVAAVPDLCGAVDGLIVGEPVKLELKAVYYDTPDLSMIRSGVTLRSRTGEPGPTWTLKLPTGSQKGGLSRHEINFDAKLGKVPAAALDAVTAYVRRSKLGPVADIQTKRTATNLLLGDVIVATICDDHVEGRFGGTGVSQFREIEVELINPVPMLTSWKLFERCSVKPAGRSKYGPFPSSIVCSAMPSASTHYFPYRASDARQPYKLRYRH